ncbi:MAG: CYTH domain-containing protein [Bacteroidales bacterium]|nr:CYTH domain-containing protein [Bacteroidales bacterium]
MAKEIEKKFLVNSTSYREASTARHIIIQGYLNRDKDATVRVRILDDKAYLTIKGRNRGIIRDEWEYPIPVADARDMLERCARGTVIEKTRYIVPYGNLCWEVDEFRGKHSGLVLAEIELPDETTAFNLPDFIGKEVSGDPRYYNSNL